MEPSSSPAPNLGEVAKQARDAEQEVGKVQANFVLGQGVTTDSSLNRWKAFFRKINKQNGYTGTAKFSVANFMFLLVIAGTEFDMAGLFLSAPLYLTYDPFYKTFLYCVVVSFFLPLLFVTLRPFIGMCCGSQGDAQLDAMFNGMAQQGGDISGSSDKAYLSTFLSRVNPHGGDMNFYHWVPGVRFYLIVKAGYTPSDVDALFRVNSISTFTFGIFQVVGVMATYIMNRPFDLYVKINIGTQILNWLLTLLYFGTNISVWMGVAGQVRTLKNHYRGMSIEYSMLHARLLDQSMEESAAAAVSKAKIERMEKVVRSMLEEAYLGRETREEGALVGGTPSGRGSPRTDLGPGTPEGGALSESDARQTVMLALEVEGLAQKETMKLARKVLRKDLQGMRPIDVHVFIDLLKEQAIACFCS